MQEVNPITLTSSLSGFKEYLLIERRFSEMTATTYCRNVNWISRRLGDKRLAEIDTQFVLELKRRLYESDSHESHVSVVLYSLRALLQYGRDILSCAGMDPRLIRTPRPPTRDVVYLTDMELQTFLRAIPLENGWSGSPRITGFCFRALVETLAATAMRISEALSLNRDSIDFEKREASIIGKGNKERVVFFTPRSIEWIQKYLTLRRDSGVSLFTTQRGRRLTVNSAQQMFRRMRLKAGLREKITPHILRHTAATLLLRNGCPIGYIKEVLGHSRLETTCRYYLGAMNKAETKKAFDRYMSVELEQ